MFYVNSHGMIVDTLEILPGPALVYALTEMSETLLRLRVSVVVIFVVFTLKRSRP